MPKKRAYTWGETGEEIQFVLWKEKLDASKGNITEAGRSMGFTKTYAMRLTKYFGLNDYAAELREKHQGYSHGRPYKD